MLDKDITKHISEGGIRQFLLKNLARTSEGFSWKINLLVIVENIEEVGKELEEDTVYEGPTLFLAGAKSNYIQEKDMESILEHFPNYQLKTISNAGHWLHAEQPKAVVEEIRSFLR